MSVASTELTELRDQAGRILAEVEKAIVGKRGPLELILLALLSDGHVLLEDYPGLAKTLIARSFAQATSLKFARIQFTPDLMPADITGTNVFNLQRNDFTLVRGPIFTTFLLADEINRAPAKTQSALLQAMQERQVTIDRETHQLSPDFTVFATQNPVEYEGTYPLPEAQKDRFMLKIDMQAPSQDEERLLAQKMLTQDDAPEAVLASGAVRAVIGKGELASLRSTLDQITIRPELIDYIVSIVRATRGHETILVGAGPRATQATLLAGRVRAVIDGRDFVTPDDIKSLAVPILGHRLILRPEFEIEGLTVNEVIARVLEDVAVPR
jgi:MoxR-like ATPase